LIKKYSYNLFVFLLVTISCFSQKTIVGNANTIITHKNVKEYDKINISGPFTVIMVNGEEGVITLKGESNLLPFIEVTVKDEVLKIHLDSKIKFKSSKKIVIRIPFVEIYQIFINGTGNLQTKGVLEQDNLKITLAGSGNINCNIQAVTTDFKLSGSGNINAKGVTLNLVSKIVGTGNINAQNLNSTNTSVTINGSGNATLVAKNTLTSIINGTGNVYYKGSPKKTKVTSKGSGTLMPIIRKH